MGGLRGSITARAVIVVTAIAVSGTAFVPLVGATGSTAAGVSATTVLSATPTPPPTAPPSDVPTPETSGDESPDPDQAYEEALAGAQTVAVAEAQQLVHEVRGELDAAERTLDDARAAADEARAAEEEARTELEIAEHEIQRTERETDEIRERSREAHAALGSVVSQAYQNNGLSTVGVLLGAESPDALNDRYLGLKTVLRAGDSALGRLAEDEAELRNALARLEGQREKKERLADQAAERRAEMEAAETAAEEARASVQERQDEYEHALELAEEAMLEDYQLYMEQLDESSAVGEYLDNFDYSDLDTPEGEDADPTDPTDPAETGEDSGAGGDSGTGVGAFVRPATGQVTSSYGARLHPILGYVKTHTGIDFGRGDGRIYAAASGTVVDATFNQAYGYMVIVDHGVVDGARLSTLYAHQTGLMVDVGQRVEQGQVIGEIGSTGYSTGPHLHFEVRVDGQHENPAPWLEGATSP